MCSVLPVEISHAVGVSEVMYASSNSTVGSVGLALSHFRLDGERSAATCGGSGISRIDLRISWVEAQASASDDRSAWSTG